MALDEDGFEIEVLGKCMTNPRAGSQHDQPVEPRYLWSYAQEEALSAVSEQGADKCWRLIKDPERRAKRIAARYADLYFKSAEKTRGKLQFHWPGLAAFVVKDIVEAYRYSRDEVLAGGWRNWDVSKLVSYTVAKGSPYEHALRVYAALAKGNLWLFMDIYPWLWFWLEYGVNNDNTLNDQRLRSHVDRRDSGTLQAQSKSAIEELPFGANWLGRLKARIAADPVYEQSSKFFDVRPVWAGEDGGYGQHKASAFQASQYVKQHIKEDDSGYRLPPSPYWKSFAEAYYVLEEERRELSRIAADAGALSRLQRVAKFSVTAEVKKTYELLIDEYKATGPSEKYSKRKDELAEIAKQEQLNVLQPLIYDDRKLVETMDINHQFSRLSSGFLSPRYAVVFSAQPHTRDPALQTVFDAPKNPWDYASGAKKSLPKPTDRMEYVALIANDYNELMSKKRDYMEGELHKIQGWLNA